MPPMTMRVASEALSLRARCDCRYSDTAGLFEPYAARPINRAGPHPARMPGLLS